MKIKYLLLTFLLLSVIFGLSIGRNVIPMWLCAVIVVVSIGILVYWFLCTLNNGIMLAEKKFAEIDDKIFNSASTISNSIDEFQNKQIDAIGALSSELNNYKNEIISMGNFIVESLNQQLSTIQSFYGDLNQIVGKVLDNIESQENNNDVRFAKLLEELYALKTNIESNYSNLSDNFSVYTERIVNLGDNMVSAVTRENEITKDTIRNAADKVEDKIVTNINSNKRDSDEAAKVLITGLHNYLESISEMLSGKSDNINSSLIQAQSILGERLSQCENILLDNVNIIISTALHFSEVYLHNYSPKDALINALNNG